MVKVTIDKHTYAMDGYLHSNLSLAKKMVKQDWDCVGIFDGLEGSGKSVLALQCAKFCDPNFDLKNIAFTGEEFEQKIRAAKSYEAIVYDEAYSGLSARQALSKINVSLVGMLAEIRQKRLFVFIVLPCFFELDKYPAIWRSRFLISVYTDENMQRGRFGYWNSKKKKKLYLLGKKDYEYKISPNFIGRFPNYYTVNEKGYRKLKLVSLERSKDTGSQFIKGLYQQRDLLMGYLIHKCGKSTRDISDLFEDYLNRKVTMRSIQMIAKKSVFNPKEKGDI